MSYAAAIECLYAAQAAVQKGWTQGAMARNSKGMDVSVHQNIACCFCALGAIQKFADPTSRMTAVHAFIEANKLRNIEGAIGIWNDEPGRRKDQVIHAFDKAIRFLSGPNYAPLPLPDREDTSNG